jgi:hypothetical protein
MAWAGYVKRMGEMRNAYKVLVGTSERKRAIERSRLSWEDNIKMDLKEIGCKGAGWTYLAQDLCSSAGPC